MVMGDLVVEVDVAVVGGGPGGYSAAFRCAELGLETVVVDAGKRLGGACLFEGCIPSKALLHVAALIEDAERARELGVDFGEPRVSLDPLRKWKSERVVGRLARGLASVAKAKSVEVIGGRAVFESSRELRVEGDEPQKVRFKHAIVATGSAPARLPGLALAGDRVIDSTAALELAEIPERLLVIGGGYIGLELGQVYAALGSQVTLVEMTDGLLPGVDRDLVQPLARRCEKLFAKIRLGTKVTLARREGLGHRGALRRGRRRRPSIACWSLSAAARRAPGSASSTPVRGVDARGFVDVDERCRTADPRDLRGRRRHRRADAGPSRDAPGQGRGGGDRGPPGGLRQRRRPRGRVHRSRGRLVRAHRDRGGARRPRREDREARVGGLGPRR